MRGAGETPPPRPAWPEILATSVVAAAVVAGLAFLTHELEVLLLLGSFAASTLIVFAYPDSPFAQPRSLLLGHLIGSAGAHQCPGKKFAAASPPALPIRWPSSRLRGWANDESG